MRAWLLHMVVGVEGQPAYVTIDTSSCDIVVEAEMEDEARAIADRQQAGSLFGVRNPWLLKSVSTCREL